MRYKVVVAKLAGVAGWGIEDVKLTPKLREAGMAPALCSLDGETPLVFPYMTRAYAWLAQCERAGLDMEDEPGFIRVYTDATARMGHLQVSKVPDQKPGPVVRELPSPWRWNQGN